MSGPALYVPKFESLTEDDRRLLLIALRALFHDLRLSHVWGWPVSEAEIKRMVARLGGDPKQM